MKKMILLAATAALTLSPQVAAAQALAAPVIAVVDIQRASAECNACKTALATLQGQLNGVKSLQASLDSSLGAEANSIQTAINALAGKAPDAALKARADAFEKKQADAQRQLQARDQAFQRNRSYVLQQIGAKLDPILSGVMTKRGATVLLDASNAVRYSPSLDVTNDAIAALNASLTALGTTAPAQAAPAAATGR